MIRHEYKTPDGVAYYWTPTEAEVRAEVASSLSHMSGGWDLKEQASRAEKLNELYAADGRDRPSHPMHGLFTGLVVGMPDVFEAVEPQA